MPLEGSMQVVYQRCCGLDIHKKLIVACLLLMSSQGVQKEIRTFNTTLADLYRLRDWHVAIECQMVAMESTGVYWRPIWNVLEEELVLMLVNAQHMKAVPGRKTDMKDAEWIAELLQHGLLRASFVPPRPQRELREVTRYRSKLVQERRTGPGGARHPAGPSPLLAQEPTAPVGFLRHANRGVGSGDCQPVGRADRSGRPRAAGQRT